MMYASPERASRALRDWMARDMELPARNPRLAHDRSGGKLPSSIVLTRSTPDCINATGGVFATWPQIRVSFRTDHYDSIF